MWFLLILFTNSWFQTLLRRPEEQSIFVAKRAIFLEDEYLWRRDSGSKVVLEEVLVPNTNATSLDENSVPENLQVHTEA